MSLPPDSTIYALLRLLSDPNEQVASTIQDQLSRLGPSVLPFLDQAGVTDTTVEPRIAFIKEEIRFEQLHDEFQKFVSQSARQEDWEHGAFLIAKLAYPDLSIPHYVECLDHLAEEFRTKWHATETPVGKAAGLLSTFLFKDKGSLSGIDRNIAMSFDAFSMHISKILCSLSSEVIIFRWCVFLMTW